VEHFAEGQPQGELGSLAEVHFAGQGDVAVAGEPVVQSM